LQTHCGSRIACAGAGAGDARYSFEDDDSRPAGQFLRKDVGVQQLDAVRDSVFADDVAYRGARIGGISERSCMVLGGVPGRERIAAIADRAIGARPSAFNTVRYSEKILERSGISVETWIFRRFWVASTG